MAIDNQSRDFIAEVNDRRRLGLLEIRPWRGDRYDQRYFCTRCADGSFGWHFSAAPDAVYHVDTAHE